MSHVEFMEVALAEARRAARQGEVPVGCVVVKQGEVIASAHNLTETLQDATAHAEQLALRSACARLGSWRLEDCDLYVTLEPCLMCAGAMVWARIRTLVYGVTDPKAGAVESKYRVLDPGILNHDVAVVSGVLADPAAALLKAFFRSLRRDMKTRRDG